MDNSDDSEPADDLARAQDVALRYRCEFVNLHKFNLNSDILRQVPVDLMFRYDFVPLEELCDGRIAIALADPSQLMSIDEISLLLGKRLVIRITTLAQINEVLHRFHEAKGSDPNPTQMTDRSPNEPSSPSPPDAPVRAPRKPRPQPRSGAARAVPEQEQ
jgi:hypothetical protein